MTEKPRILVTGATGTVGRAVLSALEPTHAEVFAFVRDAAVALPAHVRAVAGDLTDAMSVGRALDQVDAAFYLSPHIEAEETCAEVFTEACAQRRTRMVFVGSHIDHGSAFVRWMLRRAMGLLIPEFAPKFRLSEKVRGSAADPIVLAPANFFQNDEYQVVRSGLLDAHRYLAPLGPKPKNRMDVHDIAAIAARALTDESIAPGAYSLVGPASVSGPDCAAAWSGALGTEIRYEEDEEAWLTGLRGEFEGRKLDDILATYRMLKKVAVPTSPKHLASTTALLGRAPTTYAAYVGRVAASWTRTRLAS